MATNSRPVGYSPLDQIDQDNVGELRMVWSRGMTEGRQCPSVDNAGARVHRVSSLSRFGK